MQQLWETPLVQEFFQHVKSVSSFNIPPSTAALFNSYHSHFFNIPCPAFSVDWGGSSPNWKWQKLHSETMMGSVQGAITAVYYHYENLLRIERDILAFPHIQELVSSVSNSGCSFGGGNTQKLDFEYHAFIFAYRRSLDYLARGIASLIKEEFHSFRNLPNSLQVHRKHNWVKHIIDMQEKYAPQLDRFLGKGDKKSMRDILAHYVHVPAGSLNVNAGGVFFAGGGESLNYEKKLSFVINSYVQMLENILRETFDAIKLGFPKCT